MTDQIVLAMQLLAINQQVMPQLMAMMMYHVNQPLLQPRNFPATHTMPFYMLPIQNLQILGQGNFNPGMHPFIAGGRYNARGYGQSGQSAGGCCRGCGYHHRSRYPLAEQMARGDGNPGATGAFLNTNA
jgi:hypothetical protein